MRRNVIHRSETLTLTELAERWHKNRSTIWRRVNKGQLTPVPAGPQDDHREKRFSLADILRLEGKK